ncbi:MAG: bifunctional 5,10-methylenetetrahydrofolate dehydrogenase/5,10-methenyltetrahydrofolate cyclohydrolase [Bacteroidota bacterium]|nr:bifunctional 5,10-methylenetetrahydrofolate dehydrogenase/5,10-methenyltetrahydrofolate cyclohydrolase [Bacteroidota bacterium]
MQLLDGKLVSETIKSTLKTEIEGYISQGKRKPKLVAVIVGDNGASQTYVASKERNSKAVGMESEAIRLDVSTTENELLELIAKLNNDETVDGMLVQLPLPKHINANKVTDAILPHKDVDGFHPYNTGQMVKGVDTLLPATPYGILLMLEHYNIPTVGKHCVVIGRSDIVGKPMAVLMSRNAYPGNCTVTMCHSKTVDLNSYTLQADILIVASGIPEMVTGEMVKSGAVVIDVGITRMDADNEKGYVIKGDVHFDSAKEVASYITPVPGGVGLMTIAGLLMNTLNAYKKHVGIEETIMNYK